ncbi:MAG: hypothetical protein ABSA52_22990 [Candidatus Binatia bacterium]|jgi:hypothetical protein
MSNVPSERVCSRLRRHGRLPHQYTFTLVDHRALRAFAERQRVPVHKLTSGPRMGEQHPNRLRRMERWVLSRYLLAFEACGRVTFPVKVAHALRNRSPDFMIEAPSNPTEGCEVTQATTSAYQEKITRLEQRGGPRYFHGRDGRGWIGPEPEVYWGDMIRKAVTKKIGKLAKGHYQTAATQHLLIYDDMDNAAVDLAEALTFLQPKLLNLLSATKVRFDIVSVVTTQSYLLFDITGNCQVLPIPAASPAAGRYAPPAPLLSSSRSATWWRTHLVRATDPGRTSRSRRRRRARRA